MATVTAYVERDPETGLYVAIVPGVRGAHTQAESLDELNANLAEVLALCVAEGWLTLENYPRFSGLQQVEVAVSTGCRCSRSPKSTVRFECLAST